jgi:uncharacterized protein YndB with AHSA1/START domain
MSKQITIKANINKSIEDVWNCWNKPECVKQWSFADNSWECSHAEVDLKVGGKFLSTLRAKDGSAEFDFSGTYIQIIDKKLIEYVIDDGRKVLIEFIDNNESVEVIETFEMEGMNSKEAQRFGWQGFLNNFKKFAEEN